MRKAARRHCILCALPGLWLLVAFLISGGIEALTWSTPVALAADVQTKSNHQGSHYSHSSRSNRSQQDCTGRYARPFFRHAVVVDGNEVICSNITSFGGTVVVRGEVRGDIVVFGGDVLIVGGVHGDVTLYGGNVTLQNSANVYGNIHLCGGQQVLDAVSQLHGSVVGCPESMNQLLTSDAGPGFRFWSLLTWVALGVLLISLLPEHVMLVRTTLMTKTRRSLALGLLSTLLALPVLAILVALIISIPLAIIVAVGLIAAWALGTVAVGSLLGERIMRAVAPHHNTRLMQVSVGLTVLILAGSLPYIGWLISVGAGLLGLGAVLLSRFGTRLYSQPKQPIML